MKVLRYQQLVTEWWEAKSHKKTISNVLHFIIKGLNCKVGHFWSSEADTTNDLYSLRENQAWETVHHFYQWTEAKS